jgi:hypothetical protein
VVAHRVVDRFGTVDELLLDEELVAACWAVERTYPGLPAPGRSINELLRPANLPVGMDQPPPKAAPTSRRERSELEAMGARLAAEALEMVDPGLRLYPSPAPGHCGGCQFVAPCLALERGDDVAAVLAAGYRDRGPGDPRLGSATWGTGRGAAPPRFGAP